jgi:hypothetical protein
LETLLKAAYVLAQQRLRTIRVACSEGLDDVVVVLFQSTADAADATEHQAPQTKAG